MRTSEHHIMCTTEDHEGERAVGEALIFIDDVTERSFPYCGECLEVLKRGGELVEYWTEADVPRADMREQGLGASTRR